jgi:mono/diheme cytochrome c family protein
VFPLPRQRKPFYGLIAFLLTLSMTAYSVAKADDVAPVEKGSAPNALEGAGDLVLVEDAGPPRALEGKEIFESRCAACHGVDGRGNPGRQLLKIDLPDFTDCSFASREPDSDFAAVIHGGGPARGFSAQMPAHGKAASKAEIDEINSRLSGGSEPMPALSTGLDQAEIARVISHLRTFCTDERWPRGELNFPRPLLTEKAFPEDEVVITTFANVNREGFVSTHLLFEKRIGARAMVEIDLPVTSREWERGGRTEWYSGIGDLAVGTKYAFLHSVESGSIASLGAEVKAPTGNDDRGLGKGSVVFEPYLAAGQLLPRDSFVQVQLLGEIPTSGASEISLRGTLGKTFTPNLHGRGWAPMVEVIGVFALGKNSESNLDIVPQIQIPLNRRQHVRLNLGVWIPATRNDERATRVGAYLLWDWFDGGFFEGW